MGSGEDAELSKLSMSLSGSELVPANGSPLLD